MLFCWETLTTGNLEDVDFLGLFLEYLFFALICNKKETTSYHQRLDPVNHVIH